MGSGGRQGWVFGGCCSRIGETPFGWRSEKGVILRDDTLPKRRGEGIKAHVLGGRKADGNFEAGENTRGLARNERHGLDYKNKANGNAERADGIYFSLSVYLCMCRGKMCGCFYN